MPLASGSRTQLRYKPELVFGTIVTASAPYNLRRTDDSLGFKTQTQVSQEVRADRMTTDLILVGASAEGGINFEMSYSEFDPLLAGLMQNPWTVYGTNGVSPTAITTGSFTSATVMTGTTMPVSGLVRGQWVRFAFTTPTGTGMDGRLAQISRTVAPAAGTITFEPGFPAFPTGAVPSFSFQATRLINGVAQSSFTLEREHADLPQFVTFTGMTPSKLSLNFQSGSILTGSMEFMGRTQLGLQGTSRLGAAPVASKTFEVMNAVTGVGTILESGAPLTGTFIKSLTLDVDNGLRGRDAIGSLGNVEVASGTLSITGKMSVYFSDAVLYNKFINSSATSLVFSAQDPVGNGYVFTIPRAKFNEGNIMSGNKDSDSMVEMGFTALLDTTTSVSHMMSIDRVGVAAAILTT
jgi:hypothetical protein